MSYKQRPTGGEGGPSRVVAALHRTAERVRDHVGTWAARYVAMRTEARR